MNLFDEMENNELNYLSFMVLLSWLN